MSNFAGKTNVEVDTRIQITYISDFEENDLINKTGTITHPFGFTLGNELCGVNLDDKNIYTGDIVNLLIGDKFITLE